MWLLGNGCGSGLWSPLPECFCRGFVLFQVWGFYCCFCFCVLFYLRLPDLHAVGGKLKNAGVSLRNTGPNPAVPSCCQGPWAASLLALPSLRLCHTWVRMLPPQGSCSTYTRLLRLSSEGTPHSCRTLASFSQNEGLRWNELSVLAGSIHPSWASWIPPRSPLET